MSGYKVFLSFCAQDKDYFIWRLDTVLRSKAGTAVFGVEERLQDEERLESELNAIVGYCKVAIVVFSSNYNKSILCVQELEKITKCCRTSDLVVLPVFYDGVYPLHERLEGGMFDGNAFHDFIDRIGKEKDKFLSWVVGVTKATEYFGPSDLIYRYEHECVQDYIRDIGEHVSRVLKKRDSFSAFYTESINSGAQDVIQLLKQSKSPLILGIWGMPGIGKSSIVHAIYNQIGPYFEHMSFLENVEGLWKDKLEVYLEEELIFHIDEQFERKIPTIETRRMILKEKLRHKRVLLILDNVDKLDQLKALCGNREWFGRGSKIIITTRDRHLLKKHGVDYIYGVKQLDESESLELFNLGAFRQATSGEDFVELSRQVVAYSGGLPLALKVLGSNLYSKRVDFWESELHLLKMFPLQEVQRVLEDSFNDLSDVERRVFLDIALFFIGMNQNDVLETLNRSTQCTTLQISLLEDKSFLTINENNNLQMHVLLQSMARDVIRRISSNKTDQPKVYDVFLSFRGEDSRAKFMSHLFSSLQNEGIHAFKDDDEIQRGDQISISLLRAIGQSRISIIVLSTNYANSRWCMLELEKIMKIGRTKGLIVVPVFYEVDPSEVRHQKGRFGKAFKKLISKISVDESKKSSWRRDLFDIGGIAGFVLLGSRTKLFVAEHPVGLESRVDTAIKLLNIKKSDVLLLGIWGMGGTGKTTIAKAIYNQIGSKFEGMSFLLGVREFWETHTNLVSLQQQVLCDVYKTTTSKIHDIESGKIILKQRLAQKRVLFVLDDVTELHQLNALCGSREWFGSGSRIIITTRDMRLLRSCDQVYAIKEMDESESLELFSWHAFKLPSPPIDFAKHSTDVIAYSGRLPLALEVLGCYLSDCEITEWQKVLEKLKCIPHDEVQKKLRVSFDGLKDVTEQQIFLDIACFFIGMDQNDVIQILNGCGFFADSGMKILLERSLVTVDNGNKLRMHDLLRDMGRQIIYEESPLDPENRSRLWRSDEVIDMLYNDSNLKGAEAVKGLALKFPKENLVRLNSNAFQKMYKLRLLQLAGVKLKGDFKHLSRNLRWLYWHGFPLTYIPAEFQQESLVAIELKYSNLTQMWKKNKMLKNLKILNLSHSQDLTETPDFSYLPNLEKLAFKDCPSLSEVSHSIGSLHKLLLINLTDCTGLRKLPRSIYTLKSLQTLILSGCSMIDKLEEDLVQMESLITLIADKTAIKKVPFSIVRMKNIGYISLSGFEGFSRDVFPSLIRSWMSPSNNVISLVQTYVPMSSLASSKDLQKLRILCVECGSDLQLTQDIARFLDVLKATKCQNLEASASSTTSHISDLYAPALTDVCLDQVCTSMSKNYLKYLLIQMGTKCQVSNIAEECILQTADETSDSFLLPCDNNCEWSSFSCKGCSIIFDIPTIKGRNLKSMILFIVYYSSPENIASEGCQGVLIINYTKRIIQVYKRDTLTSFGHDDWRTITSILEPGNKVEVMVVLGEGFIVDKTSISLLYDEPDDKKMECCHVVDEEDVIVSGNDDNNVSVSSGDDETINRFGEETMNHIQITKHGDGLCVDIVGPIQLVPHDLDQPVEAVAEEIHPAEEQRDQEHHYPPPECEPEQHATVASATIEPTLGAQILDAIRELRADFVRHEQIVTARFNAVEVRLEELADVVTQIQRDVES